MSAPPGLFQSYRDAVKASAPGPASPAGRGSGASAVFVLGAALAVIGGIAMAWQSGNHSACNSVLVQVFAQSQCSDVDTIWTTGVVGLVLGVGLIITGAILRGRP